MKKKLSTDFVKNNTAGNLESFLETAKLKADLNDKIQRVISSEFLELPDEFDKSLDNLKSFRLYLNSKGKVVDFNEFLENELLPNKDRYLDSAKLKDELNKEFKNIIPSELTEKKYISRFLALKFSSNALGKPVFMKVLDTKFYEGINLPDNNLCLKSIG